MILAHTLTIVFPWKLLSLSLWKEAVSHLLSQATLASLVAYVLIL